jgi:hypothetical protein
MRENRPSGLMSGMWKRKSHDSPRHLSTLPGELVAQIFNLLYRGFATRWRVETARRSSDFKSAIQQSATLRYDEAPRVHWPTRARNAR